MCPFLSEVQSDEFGDPFAEEGLLDDVPVFSTRDSLDGIAVHHYLMTVYPNARLVVNGPLWQVVLTTATFTDVEKAGTLASGFLAGMEFLRTARKRFGK